MSERRPRDALGQLVSTFDHRLLIAKCAVVPHRDRPRMLSSTTRRDPLPRHRVRHHRSGPGRGSGPPGLGARVLEIAPGTGQATVPRLQGPGRRAWSRPGPGRTRQPGKALERRGRYRRRRTLGRPGRRIRPRSSARRRSTGSIPTPGWRGSLDATATRPCPRSDPDLPHRRSLRRVLRPDSPPPADLRSAVGQRGGSEWPGTPTINATAATTARNCTREIRSPGQCQGQPLFPGPLDLLARHQSEYRTQREEREREHERQDGQRVGRALLRAEAPISGPRRRGHLRGQRGCRRRREGQVGGQRVELAERLRRVDRGETVLEFAAGQAALHHGLDDPRTDLLAIGVRRPPERVSGLRALPGTVLRLAHRTRVGQRSRPGRV